MRVLLKIMLLFLSYWHFVFGVAFAQKKEKNAHLATEELILEAENMYERGLPDSVLTLLNTKKLRQLRWRKIPHSVKTEIYWLRAHSNLLNGNKKEAQQDIKKLLEITPEYTQQVTDLQDFTYFRNQMFIAPKWAVEFKVGGNQVNPVIQESNSVFEYDAQQIYDDIFYGIDDVPTDVFLAEISTFYDSPDTYTASEGGQIGLGVEYTLNRAFSLGTEQIYEYYAFEQQSNTLKANFRRSFSYWNRLFYLKYYPFRRWKISPYVRGGVFSRLALGGVETETNRENRKQFFSKLNQNVRGLSWGIGIQKRQKKSYFALEIRQKMSSDIILNPQQAPLMNDKEGINFLFNLYSFDDAISLTVWEINFTFGLQLNHKVFKK